MKGKERGQEDSKPQRAGRSGRRGQERVEGRTEDIVERRKQHNVGDECL